MNCSACRIPNSKMQCGACGILYCSAQCQHSDWNTHRTTCMLIQGKRSRSSTPESHEEMDDLMLLVFSTLRRTPEMLENLANVMTLQQLRDLKFNKSLNHTIWRNSLFWYYIIRRHRPDILKNAPFDSNFPYKKLAMRRIVAPDYTIRHPQPGEMDPRLQQVLKIMMQNPTAIDVLLRNISWIEIRNYMRVSVDFKRLVADSNILWFILWREYGEYDNIPYKYTVNYRQKLYAERPTLFDKALIINFYEGPLVVRFEGESRKYWNSITNEVTVTIMDILKDGGLEQILDVLDRNFDFHLLGESESFNTNRGKIFVYYYLNGYEGDSEMWDNAPPFTEMISNSTNSTIDELESRLLNGEEDMIQLSYEMILEMPEKVTLTIRYPQTIQPYRYDMSRRDWVAEGFAPGIMMKPVIEKVETFDYYKEDGQDELMYIDLNLPAYFAPRGEMIPLDLEQWGYLKINGEYAHFERLEEKVRAYIVQGINVLVEMIPK